MAPNSIGKYSVTGRLGEGAMGEVFLGQDPLIDRAVAIKLLKTTHAEDKQRFLQEARTVGALSHPNIVVLYDSGFEDERPYLVMEYAPGQNLEAWLREPHEVAEHLVVIEGLCRALNHAHARDVLHRDLKPSNIQVTPEGHCKLMDFGIARSLTGRISESSGVVGTPAYMAPEILEDAHYSARADIYSAGVVVYEMLAGVNPFVGKTVAATLTNVLNLRPPHLIVQRPVLASELSHAVMACLAREPRERPPDLSHLLQVATRLRSAGVTGTGHVVSRAAHAMTHSLRNLAPLGTQRRRRLGWGLAGGGAALLLAATAWVAHQSGERTGRLGQARDAVQTGSPIAPHTASASPQRVDPRPAGPTGTTTAPEAASSQPPRPRTSPPRSPAAAADPRLASSKPTGLAPSAPAAPGEEPASGAPAVVVPPGPNQPPARAGVEGGAPAIEVAPPRAELTSVKPASTGRRSMLVLELRGSDLRPEHRVQILRGGRAAPGIHVVRQQYVDPGLTRATVIVDADVPPGRYSVALADEDALLSNSLTFEVTL